MYIYITYLPFCLNDKKQELILHHYLDLLRHGHARMSMAVKTLATTQFCGDDDVIIGG